jgi:hypothetical protein
MEAYILISNDISDVKEYVFSLSQTQIYVCISVVQDGVIVNATSVIV